MYGYNNFGEFGYGSMMNGIGGGIFMIFIWVLLIVFIVWIVREVINKNSNTNSSKAMEILKERYAKGEINKDEFELRKKDLI